MGSATSRIAERLSLSSSSRGRSIPSESPQEDAEKEKRKKTDRGDGRSNATPKTGDYLIRSRKGSMYYDEDGDLAHEFYEEVPAKEPGKKASMTRVCDNLKPQGQVPYDTARLSQEYPYVVADL